MKLTINIDGGSRGNPGPAAYGCYVQPESGPAIELKGRLGRTTNNVAEYHGLLRGLEKALEMGADHVLILADSELLVKQLRGEYRVKNEHLLPLFRAAQSLIDRLGQVQFRHVYREQNKEADRLCNEALDDPRLPVEPLGLRHGVAKQEEPAHQPPPASPSNAMAVREYVKVKVQGVLLATINLQRRKEYAVVVAGTSWKLELARVPPRMVSGDPVVVLGELALRAGKPVIRVQKIKSMKND